LKQERRAFSSPKRAGGLPPVAGDGGRGERQSGVRTPAVSLRLMHNKWASCSIAGNLNLNAGLIELDRVIGDYVIVHEL
jgi:hypothetical protein